VRATTDDCPKSMGAGAPANPLTGEFGLSNTLGTWRVRQMGRKPGATSQEMTNFFIQRLRQDKRVLDMLVEGSDAARRTTSEAKRVRHDWSTRHPRHIQRALISHHGLHDRDRHARFRVVGEL
jgi:hypothetical protein